MARKPNTQPATAYQYRRALALVQVLAIDDFNALLELATTWGISEPTANEISDAGGFTLSMITNLAQHALEQGRADEG